MSERNAVLEEAAIVLDAKAALYRAYAERAEQHPRDTISLFIEALLPP